MIDPVRLEAQRRAITDPQPAPEKYRIPAEFMSRVCSACLTNHITDRNTTGVCRDCWNGMGKRQRREFQAQRTEGRGK